MAADTPAPNLDPAESERLLLAQLVGRRALAGRVVHRLAPWSRNPSLPLHAFPTALNAPFHGVAERRLQPATYPRREAQDQASVDRFWWRRVAPHLALLARRRARLLAGSARAAAQPAAEVRARVQESSTAWPAVAADLAPGLAGAELLGVAPIETGEVDSQPLDNSAPTRAWDPEAGSAAGGGGPAGTVPAAARAIEAGGALSGIRASVVAAWQRLATVLAPARAQTRAAGSTDPPLGASGPAEPATEAAVDGDAPVLAPDAIQGLDTAELREMTEEAARSAGVETAHIPAAHEPGPAWPETVAESADAFDGPEPDADEGSWSAEPASLADSIAPLATRIGGRMSTSPAGLLASSAAGASPTRVFWWPTARATAGQAGATSSASPVAPARAPHEPVDVTLAPGLLGNLRRIQQSAASPPERSLDLAKEIRRADEWARENVADHERWRVHPVAFQPSDGESTAPPSAPEADLIFAPSGRASEPGWRPAAPTAAPDQALPSAPSASAPSASEAAVPSLGAVPAAAGPSGAGPAYAQASGAEGRVPFEVESVIADVPHSSAWASPLELVGGLLRALTGRTGQAAGAVSVAGDGGPKMSGPEPAHEITPTQAGNVPTDAGSTAAASAIAPEAAALPASAPAERIGGEPPVPVVRVQPSGGGEAPSASADIFHALTRRLTRAPRAQASVTSTDAGRVDVPGPSRGRHWSDREASVAPESAPNAPGGAGKADILPERPWESSDGELTAVINSLPAPMRAAAIAAGVLGEAAPAFPAGTSSASPGRWEPFESPTHAPSFHAARGSYEILAGPAAATPAPAPWSPIEATHPVGPAWAAAASAALHAPAGPMAGPSTGTGMGQAAAASGIARAPIDRAAAESTASGPLAAAAPAGPSGAPGQAPAGAWPPDLDKLTEEVFDRLRWRLGAERERYVP